MPMKNTRRNFIFLCSIEFCSFLFGCERKPQREVILYTSEDQPVAAPILRVFEQRTGIHVAMLTDTEAAKSVGLAERLLAEKDRPQADVWWSNEVFRTIALSEQSVLSPYDSPSAKDIPSQFKDAGQHWAGVGLRVRVLAISDQMQANVLVPAELSDLTKPAFKHKIAMARPTAGTTGSQVAALYVLWGEARADAFFRQLRNNEIALLGGNSVVADCVGQGQVWVGMTDNDDVAAARANNLKLHAVLPDQHTLGTLPIPGSVALIAGAQHPAEARALIDYLLSPEVEQQLIGAQSAACSVRSVPPEMKLMDVDYQAVAQAMPQAIRRATSILEGR